MSIVQKAIGLVRRPLAEVHARGNDIEDLADELETSGHDMMRRMEGKPDTNGNREAVAHWIGIERWGQRRLKVTLGEPLVMDEHYPYKPEGEKSFEELTKVFAETRKDTVALARTLDEAGVDPDGTVPHNDLGDLTVRGWLAYLIQHPDQEARARLRG